MVISCIWRDFGKGQRFADEATEVLAVGFVETLDVIRVYRPKKDSYRLNR